MIKLFSFKKRRKRQERELAPQLTAWQRRALEVAGVPPAGLPYSTYDEMEKDSMVQTCLTVKKLGVVAAEWRIVGDQRRSEFVEEAFARMDGSPHTILSGAMDAFAKGWSVQEIVYDTDGLMTWIEAVRPKDPSLFGLEVDRFGHLRELKLQLPGESVMDVPRSKFVVYSNRGSYGRAKGRSDLDPAYRHWSSKQSLLNAWKFHLERFAMPTVLGSFERGLSAEEQASILSAMQNLSQHTAVIFPNEIAIDTLGGQKESSSGFMEALDFHNREIARAILGQTLTTDEGRRVGSLAMGKVHLQVLLLQLEAIRRELADVVMTEQVIRPLVELNFGPGPIPRFEFVSTPVSAFATGELA
ncbi:MAG: DUF935 family protein [Fimbriimonadaceae bacterium]